MSFAKQLHNLTSIASSTPMSATVCNSVRFYCLELMTEPFLSASILCHLSSSSDVIGTDQACLQHATLRMRHAPVLALSGCACGMRCHVGPTA